MSSDPQDGDNTEEVQHLTGPLKLDLKPLSEYLCDARAPAEVQASCDTRLLDDIITSVHRELSQVETHEQYARVLHSVQSVVLWVAAIHPEADSVAVHIAGCMQQMLNRLVVEHATMRQLTTLRDSLAASLAQPNDQDGATNGETVH